MKKLMPGNNGNDCLYNGEHCDMNGNIIECCCDECDYLMCCIEEFNDCSNCECFECHRKIKKGTSF